MPETSSLVAKFIVKKKFSPRKSCLKNLWVQVTPDYYGKVISIRELGKIAISHMFRYVLTLSDHETVNSENNPSNHKMVIRIQENIVKENPK